MSTIISVSPQTQAAIDQCKKTTLENKHRFETTLSFVPDDKIGFKPSDTARSALQLAAHVAFSNDSFAMIIRREMPTSGDLSEVFRKQQEAEAAITTRAEAIAKLEDSTNAVLAAIDTINDETIGVDVPTPVFTAPMTFWMYLPARHLDNHAAQIDYLQTIWGDMEWHMR